MKTLLLLFCLAAPVLYSPAVHTPVAAVTGPCSETYELSSNSIPTYRETETKTGFGPKDGRFFYWIITFSDNTTGRLFQGGSSQRFFVEDSNGNNYYYIDRRAAVRALYIYKKHGCFSTIDRG
ncbi:hypothetical protein [Emticicia sp. 17c]|uniref:hypothetical protein n=1 Tax=Emticicia sp. 17c TaxID=3127704 RepID=UPI00301C4146